MMENSTYYAMNGGLGQLFRKLLYDHLQDERPKATEVVYQCSAPHRGTSVKLISAEELDELAKQPSSSDFNVGNPRIRILGQLVDSRSTNFYHMQREIRKTEKIPGREDLIQVLWFEHYWASHTELIKSSIGRDLLQAGTSKGPLPKDHPFNYS
ncbi:Immunoglobulin/major histocompatibility complex, conserved site [Penicillium camemberti]|uniref:Immunoglobulin/major histocompatibility complex, conserved site n=1 Tax=Penicillium camemberti (strain FM 013) TaxID=1429867 RepID=A0A0G4PVR5_PENC3|nr:Immunoglobulin/major histocompatibility complex, conserved site [Penicillium camemberti]